MADVNANIGVNIDTSEALAQLKALQRQISQFHSSIAKSSESAAIAQRSLQKNLLGSINSIGAFSAELRTVKTSAESFTNSLEKNKFSMREYFRYAGASTKTFGKLFKTEFDTIGKVAEERVKTLQTQYIKMGRNASGAMEAIAIRPTTLNMQDLGTKTAIAAQKQALFNQLMKQGSTNLLNFGKNTQWAGRQLMVGFTIPLSIVGSTATKTFMDMEAQALKFKKVYGDLFTPRAETQEALDNITELGKQFTKYGIAVSQTVGLAAEAAAAGFQGLDLQRQTTEATRLSVLGQIDNQKALETTISLQNAFGMSSDKLADSINFLNAVENQTVVSLDDITTAIPKVAPVIQQLGGDVKDLTFFIAAMKEGGINASEGANALKSGLAALINPTKKASQMLSQFGINANEIVTKNKGNLKATVIEFATALNKLDPLNRAQAIEQMFGKFQFARLSTLFANVAKDGNQAARVLSLANSSVEELSALSEQELGMTADSAMNKFKKSVEDLKLALVPVGKAFLEAATPIVEFVGGILEKFGNLSDGTKKLITFLTVGIGAIGPIFLMTFGLIANALANGLKGVLILRQGYLRLTGQSKILGEQTQYLNTEQLEAAAAAHSLDQSHAKLTQQFTAETAALQQLIAAYQSAARAGQSFMLNNPGMMLPPRGGKKLASGIVSVPGPKGAGDIVPAMLSPGEAVIPSEMAQKYAPLIQGMVAGNIPGYIEGKLGAAGQSIPMNFSTISVETRIQSVLDKMLSGVSKIQNAENIIAETLLRISSDTRVSYSSFVRELDVVASEISNIRIPEKIVGERDYSASGAGVSGTVSQNLEKTRGSLGVEEAKRARVAAEAVYEEYKKLGISGVKLEQALQVDRAHVIDVTQAEKRYKEAWDTRLYVAQARAENEMSMLLTQENNQKAYVTALNRVDASGDIKNSILNKITKDLALTEEELQVQAKILVEMQSDASLMKTTSSGFSNIASGTIAAAKARAAMGPASPGVGSRSIDEIQIAQQQLTKTKFRGDLQFVKQLETTGENAIASAIEAMKKKAKTKSPSRETQNIGKDIGAGLVVGMQEMQDDVTRSATQLSSAATTGIKGGVKSIPFQGAGQQRLGATIPQVAANVPMSPQVNEKVQESAKAMKSMNDRLRSLDRALMTSSFAISSLAGVASMSGGKLGEMSGSIFKVTTAMFALQAVTSLLTQSGMLRLATERGLNAGLLVQNIATRRASINTTLFSGGITKLIPNLLRFGGIIVRFLGPVGLVIGGLLGMKKIIDIVNSARAKEKLAIEGVGKAANITEGQLKKLGEIYGFVPTQTKLSITPTVAGVVGAQRTKVEETKELYKTDKEFKQNVETLRNASVKEADLIFNTMALRLLGAGATQEAIENIIVALREEAGRTELKFNFKGIDLNTEEGKANLKKNINDIVSTFSKEFNEGFKEIKTTTGGRGSAGSTVTSSVKIISQDLKKSLSTTSNVLAADMASLKGLLEAGTIDAKTFAESFDLISSKMKEMNQPAALYLLSETIKTLNPDLQKTVGKIKNVNDQMIILQALTLGLKIEAKQINAINAGGTVGASTIAGIQKQITDRINAQADAAKKATNEYQNLNTTTSEKTPKQIVQERTKALLDQSKAYTILTAKGYDAKTAADLAGESLVAAAIASGKVKVGTKEWQNLINKLKDAQFQADAVSAKIELDQQQQDIEIQLQAYQKLVKAGVDAKQAAESVGNVSLAKLILNTKNAKITMKDLTEQILKAAQLENLLKNISDPFGKTVSSMQSIMDKFNNNNELMMEKFRIQEERARQQFQPAIDAAQEAVDKIQEKIDSTNSQFNKLLDPLQLESSVLSNNLAIIDNISKDINEKYDAQSEALQKISDINSEITQQQQKQLTLADALSSGDISAAAAAVQEMRGSAAERALTGQSGTLEAARQSELNAIRVNGMSRLDIEKRQYAIGQQQYALEKQRDTLLRTYNTELETANTKLKTAQLTLSTQLKLISDQKQKWVDAKLAIDEAENSVRTMNISLAEQLKLVKEIIAAWAGASSATESAPTANVPSGGGTSGGTGGGTSGGTGGGTSGGTNAGTSPYPAGSSSFTYGAGNPLSGIIPTTTGQKVTPTTSTASIATNLGINNPISKVISTVTKPIVSTVKAVASIPSTIVTQTKVLASGVSNVIKNVASSVSSAAKSVASKIFGGFGLAQGGLVPKYMANGGRAMGSDTVPAMLTPGEFVMNRRATKTFGPLLSMLNESKYPSMIGSSYDGQGRSGIIASVNNNSSNVYNYSIGITVPKSNANTEDIARAVIKQIKYVDNQRIRGQR